MKNWIAALLLASALPAWPQSAPLGRLFFTPEQRILLDRQRQHLVTHAPVGCEFGPGPAERLDQIAFIQRNDGANVLGLRRDQRARQLAFGKLRLCSNQNQDLV